MCLVPLRTVVVCERTWSREFEAVFHSSGVEISSFSSLLKAQMIPMFEKKAMRIFALPHYTILFERVVLDI
jgi:hypothetical protein